MYFTVLEKMFGFLVLKPHILNPSRVSAARKVHLDQDIFLNLLAEPVQNLLVPPAFSDYTQRQEKGMFLFALITPVNASRKSINHYTAINPGENHGPILLNH